MTPGELREEQGLFVTSSTFSMNPAFATAPEARAFSLVETLLDEHGASFAAASSFCSPFSETKGQNCGKLV